MSITLEALLIKRAFQSFVPAGLLFLRVTDEVSFLSVLSLHLIGERVLSRNGTTKHFHIYVPLFKMKVLIFHITVADYKMHRIHLFLVNSP